MKTEDNINKDMPTLEEIKSDERAEARADKKDKVLKLYPRKNTWDAIEKYTPIEGFEVYEISITDLKLHEMANEHPLHTDLSRESLKRDIEQKGQNDPVVIYRGKIVDGRHRYWILKELGVKSIFVRLLPSSYTLDDVREHVFTTETRRHQTATQKAIQAYLYKEETGQSYNSVMVKFSASKAMIMRAKFVAEHRGKRFLDELYNGRKVSIGVKSTDNLTTLERYIREEIESERKANSKVKPMDPSEVKIIGNKYIDGLEREHDDVIRYVGKVAYSMIKD